MGEALGRQGSGSGGWRRAGEVVFCRRPSVARARPCPPWYYEQQSCLLLTKRARDACLTAAARNHCRSISARNSFQAIGTRDLPTQRRHLPLPNRLPLRPLRLTSSSPLQVVRSPSPSLPSLLLLYDPPLSCTSNRWLPTPDSYCFSSLPPSRSRDDPEDKCARRKHLRRFSASYCCLRRPRNLGPMVWTQVSPSCISIPAIADSTQYILGRPQNRHYSLEVVQHPIRARMCGFGDKVSPSFPLVSAYMHMLMPLP